jgi:hypothetical protein
MTLRDQHVGASAIRLLDRGSYPSLCTDMPSSVHSPNQACSLPAVCTPESVPNSSFSAGLCASRAPNVLLCQVHGATPVLCTLCTESKVPGRRCNGPGLGHQEG